MILPWFGFKFSNLPYLNKWYFSLKFKIHFPVGNSDLLDKSPFWVEIKKIRFLGSTLNVITLFWKNLKNTFVDKSLNQLWLSNWYSAFTKELWSECLCYSKTAKIPKHVSPGILLLADFMSLLFYQLQNGLCIGWITRQTLKNVTFVENQYICFLISWIIALFSLKHDTTFCSRGREKLE